MTTPRSRSRSLRPGGPSRRARLPETRVGVLPGAMVQEAPKGEPPRITAVAYTRDHVEELAGLDEALARRQAAGTTWIDVGGLGDPALLRRIGHDLGLHDLAVEDVVNVPQRPKVERYADHYFVVLRTVRVEEGGAVEEQVSLFFGHGWVLTVQERRDGDRFATLRDAVRHGRGRARTQGADYLAFLLLDAVVDGYFPVLESFVERVDLLEAEALDDAATDTLARIQRARREALVVRRAIWPLREEIALLQRDEGELVAPDTHVFLRDTYDHAVQALEIVESLRETLTSVMEVYLSAQNQRLNVVMKVLTVIATLFIPLTFIASIYGMNFEHMPELKWHYGYPATLGLMVVTAGVMVLYFRRKGWW